MLRTASLAALLFVATGAGAAQRVEFAEFADVEFGQDGTAVVVCDGHGSYAVAVNPRTPHPRELVEAHELSHIHFLERFAPDGCGDGRRGEMVLMPDVRLLGFTECIAYYAEFRATLFYGAALAIAQWRMAASRYGCPGLGAMSAQSRRLARFYEIAGDRRGYVAWGPPAIYPFSIFNLAAPIFIVEEPDGSFRRY